VTGLIRYDAACRALAECKAIDEVKTWVDMSAAMQAYGRMANDKSMEVDAAEIRIRAERRLGEMIVETKAAGGLNPSATLKRGPVVVTDDHGKKAPKLADAGISKDQSSRAQKLAAIPDAEFEAEVGEWRGRVKAEGNRVTARLEQAGERAQKAAVKNAREVEAQRIADDAHSDSDPFAELADAQAEVDKLNARIKAMQADDAKAEILKQRQLYEDAVRKQVDAQASVKRLEGELQRAHERMLRIGKMFNERDESKIAALVEKFVREHRKVAA
jgi:hypothetical protein